MAVLGHVVTGAAVKVSLPTGSPGISEARIIRTGQLLPRGVDPEAVQWLLERDLVRSIDDLLETGSAGEDPSADLEPADPSEEEDAEVEIVVAEDFDPSDLSVEQVLEVLEAAPADEVERILAAEAAGKNRKTIRDWTPVAD